MGVYIPTHSAQSSNPLVLSTLFRQLACSTVAAARIADVPGPCSTRELTPRPKNTRSNGSGRTRSCITSPSPFPHAQDEDCRLGECRAYGMSEDKRATPFSMPGEWFNNEGWAFPRTKRQQVMLFPIKELQFPDTHCRDCLHTEPVKVGMIDQTENKIRVYSTREEKKRDPVRAISGPACQGTVHCAVRALLTGSLYHP